MRRAVAICDVGGLTAAAISARVNLSALLLTRGRWPEARSVAERAVADSRLLGSRPGATFPLVALGRILLLLGERQEGVRILEEARELATTFGFVPGLLYAGEALAWQEVRDGRPAEAIARLEPLLQQARNIGDEWCQSVYVWAQLELGGDQRADEVLRDLRQQQLARRSRAGRPKVLLQSARLAFRQGRREAALRDLEEGLTIARGLGLAHDEALLLEECGRLPEALTLFQRLGARPDAERIAPTLGGVTLPAS